MATNHISLADRFGDQLSGSLVIFSEDYQSSRIIFTYVIFGIIFVSSLPSFIENFRERNKKKKEA